MPRVSCRGLAHLKGMLSGDGPGSVAIIIDAIAQGLHARDEGREGQSGIRDLQTFSRFLQLPGQDS